MVQVGDGDRAKTNSRPVFSDGSCDGALFGATGQPVGTVFDVAAGNDRAIREKQGRADAELAVRGVGMPCSSGCKLAQVGFFLRFQIRGWR